VKNKGEVSELSEEILLGNLLNRLKLNVEIKTSEKADLQTSNKEFEKVMQKFQDYSSSAKEREVSENKDDNKNKHDALETIKKNELTKTEEKYVSQKVVPDTSTKESQETAATEEDGIQKILKKLINQILTLNNKKSDSEKEKEKVNKVCVLITQLINNGNTENKAQQTQVFKQLVQKAAEIGIKVKDVNKSSLGMLLVTDKNMNQSVVIPKVSMKKAVAVSKESEIKTKETQQSKASLKNKIVSAEKKSEDISLVQTKIASSEKPNRREIRESPMETKKVTVIIPREMETSKQESPKISVKAENINKILSFASQALKNNETKKTESISQVLFNASINKNFERKQIFTESKSIGEKNWVPLRTQERTNDFLNIKSEMPFIPLSDIRKESSYIPQQKENIKDGEMTVEKVKENDKELPQKIQSIKEQPKNEKPTEKRSELTERQTTNEDIQKEMTVETTFEDMYERIQTQATQTESKSGNTVISDSTSTSRTPAASGSGTIRNTPVQNVPLERLNTDLHRIIEQKLTQRVFTESMDLQISPPNLGKVNLELIKTGMAISINVITETESSRESISRNLQNLVGTLRNEGYNPVQVNIKSENKNDLMQDNQQKQPNYKDQQEQKKDDSQEFEKILRGEENV
jgi:hypothetical protein